MEGSFAPAANHDHCKRARWRRLHRQQIQDWINATVKNVARSAERRAQLSPPNSLNGPAKVRRRPRGRFGASFGASLRKGRAHRRISAVSDFPGNMRAA
jgi:hypothetical protein